MDRQLIPGIWGRCGRAIPDPQASELDNVVPMRPDLRQGRDSTTPVGRYSMLAGKPIDHEMEREHDARSMFWQSCCAAIALLAVCAFLLAVWPV